MTQLAEGVYICSEEGVDQPCASFVSAVPYDVRLHGPDDVSIVSPEEEEDDEDTADEEDVDDDRDNTLVLLAVNASPNAMKRMLVSVALPLYAISYDQQRAPLSRQLVHYGASTSNEVTTFVCTMQPNRVFQLAQLSVASDQSGDNDVQGIAADYISIRVFSSTVVDSSTRAALQEASVLKDACAILSFPLKREYRCLQPFGGSMTHCVGSSLHAVDLACEHGDAVIAPVTGVIDAVHDGSYASGIAAECIGQDNHVSISFEHNNDRLLCCLVHMQPNTFCVQEGQHIKAGDYLCSAGASGFSPWLHLHVQVMPYEQPECTLPFRFESKKSEDVDPSL